VVSTIVVPKLQKLKKTIDMRILYFDTQLTATLIDYIELLSAADLEIWSSWRYVDATFHDVCAFGTKKV